MFKGIFLACIFIYFFVGSLRIEAGNTKKLMHHNKRDLKTKHIKAKLSDNFYEVEALGEDFIDFGSQTGPHG